MKTHRYATSLSLVALGMLTTSLVACAGETADDTTESATDEQASSITARGIAVTGCGANGQFNISNSLSNFSKNVDFIAIDQSDFAKLTSQLSSLNEQNQQELVSNDASALDSSLQKMINEFTNETTARQASSTKLREHQSANASTSIVETASHSDRSIVTSDSFSESMSSRSGSASNRALSTNSISNFNLVAAAQNDASGFSNVASQYASGGGGGVVGLPIALGVAAITAPFFSSSSFAESHGWNDASVRSVQKDKNDAFNLVASNNESSYADYVKQSQREHLSSEQANEWSRTLRSETADATSRDFESWAANEASQAASQRGYDANIAKSERSSHVAFESLASLHAKDFVLNLNMQANDNRAHTLRLFTGTNNQISEMRDFVIAFPSCL